MEGAFTEAWASSIRRWSHTSATNFVVVATLEVIDVCHRVTTFCYEPRQLFCLKTKLFPQLEFAFAVDFPNVFFFSVMESSSELKFVSKCVFSSDRFNLHVWVFVGRYDGRVGL